MVLEIGTGIRSWGIWQNNGRKDNGQEQKIQNKVFAGDDRVNLHTLKAKLATCGQKP